MPGAPLSRCRRAVVALVLGAGLFAGCEKSTPPPTREIVRLSGDSYDRGLQHGQALRSKIRSFYTTLLTTSLYPYLGRQQPDIAAFLTEYGKDRYRDGGFSYALLIDSAREMEKSIPKAYRDEMRGIADGSGLSYDEVLILNTFVDTVMAVRGVAAALHASEAPRVLSVEVPGLGADQADNDGDGSVDEEHEGLLSPYVPSAVASLVEIPADAQFRFVLFDADGVDPRTVRIQLDETVFEPGDPAIEAVVDPEAAERLLVTFRPPAPLAAAATISVVIQAGDAKLVSEPAPSHARFMRDERLTFTVKGAGRKPHEVANRGFADGRSQPPAIAFAARGAATGGGPLLATHFALLDANTAHKHTVLLVHKPTRGPAFVTVGWAGVIWGFSGLNTSGLAYGCNYSDTLDNSVIAGLLEQIVDINQAKLVTAGLPIGLSGRRMLETSGDVTEAELRLREAKHTYGWNCLLADGKGGLRAVEVDSDVSQDGGIFSWGPEADDAEGKDAFGRPLASIGADDLRMSSHYLKNTADIFTLEVAGQRIVPQRGWSSYWFRSLRAFDLLGERIQAAYGRLSPEAAMEILSEKALVDQSDSMNAVVIEPGTLRLHVAMGTVPATDAPFEMFDLAAEAQ